MRLGEPFSSGSRCRPACTGSTSAAAPARSQNSFSRLILERCAPKAVTAVDPAKDQIAFARTKPAAKVADFQIGDAQSLPFADNSFDAATMALVIAFIPDPAKAVAEIKRVVKSGGTAGTYMWDFLGRRSTQEPLRKAVEAMGFEVPPAPGHANATVESLNGFFVGAGLEQIQTRTIDIKVEYPSFDDYWSSQTALANTVVQHIRKMTAPQVERLQAYLREHLPTDRNGHIAYAATANAVKGRIPG